MKKISLFLIASFVALALSSCADPNYTRIKITPLYKDKPMAGVKLDVKLSSNDKAVADTSISAKIDEAFNAGKIFAADYDRSYKGTEIVCEDLVTDENGEAFCNIGNKFIEDIYVPSLYQIEIDSSYNDYNFKNAEKEIDISKETEFEIKLEKN